MKTQPPDTHPTPRISESARRRFFEAFDKMRLCRSRGSG